MQDVAAGVTMMKWFGTYWPSPATWFGTHVACPLRACYICDIAFEDGDQGLVLSSPFEDSLFESRTIEDLSAVLALHRRADETIIAVHRKCIVDALLLAAQYAAERTS